MKTVQDKLLRRFVWGIGLVFLILGFVTPLTGIPLFSISIILALELVAVYILERRFIGVIGHIGFFLSLLGALLAFNLQGYLAHFRLNDILSIITFGILIIVFIVGLVIFSVSTIRTNFLPNEIPYLLLATPIFIFLPIGINRFAFAASILAIGYFLMMFVSRVGEYDKKIATQQRILRNPPRRDPTGTHKRVGT